MARVAGVDMFTGAASRFVISINIRNDGLWSVTDRHGLFGQPNVWNTPYTYSPLSPASQTTYASLNYYETEWFLSLVWQFFY